jgi:hypothetical protein
MIRQKTRFKPSKEKVASKITVSKPSLGKVASQMTEGVESCTTTKLFFFNQHHQPTKLLPLQSHPRQLPQGSFNQYLPWEGGIADH